MKRAALRRSVIALLISVALSAAAPAALSATGSGTILIGHPGTAVGTTTEWEFDFMRNCDPSNIKGHGVDGWIIDMESNSHIRVWATSGVNPISFNIAFYDSGCNFKGSDSLFNGGSDVYKNGQGNKWAVVSLYYGSNVAFNWKTCSPTAVIPTSCF